MNLKDVRQIQVKRQKRHRVGRGQGSGWGTTSGRGNKGAGQRSGNRIRLHFEGGQMPIYRRLPKKGFTNASFKQIYHVVNVGDLERVCEAGATVDLDVLKKLGFAPKKAKHLKILGWGELAKSVHLKAHAVSEGARGKIEAAGGSIEVLPTHTPHRAKGVKRDATKRSARDEAPGSAS